MTVTVPFARPVVEPDMVDEARHRRELARVINLAMRGHMNVTLFVTLDAGIDTTDVIDARISAQTCVALCPMTANAAAAIPTTYVTCENGTMTIHHGISALTDRTFIIGMIG